MEEKSKKNSKKFVKLPLNFLNIPSLEQNHSEVRNYIPNDMNSLTKFTDYTLPKIEKYIIREEKLNDKYIQKYKEENQCSDSDFEKDQYCYQAIIPNEEWEWREEECSDSDCENSEECSDSDCEDNQCCYHFEEDTNPEEHWDEEEIRKYEQAGYCCDRWNDYNFPPAPDPIDEETEEKILESLIKENFEQEQQETEEYIKSVDRLHSRYTSINVKGTFSKIFETYLNNLNNFKKSKENVKNKIPIIDKMKNFRKGFKTIKKGFTEKTIETPKKFPHEINNDKN